MDRESCRVTQQQPEYFLLCNSQSTFTLLLYSSINFLFFFAAFLEKYQNFFKMADYFHHGSDLTQPPAGDILAPNSSHLSSRNCEEQLVLKREALGLN